MAPNHPAGNQEYRRKENAGKAGEHDRQSEREGKDAIDVDADLAGALHILGDGSNCLSETSSLKEHLKQCDDQQRNDKYSHAIGRNDNAENVNGAVDKSRHRLADCTEYDEVGVVEYEGQTKRDHHRRHFPVLAAA